MLALSVDRPQTRGEEFANGASHGAGFLLAVAAVPLLSRMPAAGLAWLVAGGLSYTLGAVVFLSDHRVRYARFVWHLFVLGGSVCHFFAALWYAQG